MDPATDAGEEIAAAARFPWRPAILQLHATAHCNLACRHCYSSSGPRRKGRLDPSTVARLLEDAAALGYGILSVSGGEPLMDPGLFDHLSAARALGYQVDLVSNGTLIDDSAAERLGASADLVAISLDGPPRLHDSLRDAPGSFERAVAGLRRLKRTGLGVAIIHTVRPETLRHLPWLLGFARDEGIGLVQLHPLEPVGRARTGMAATGPGELETRLAMLVALLSDEERSGVKVHCDILDVEVLANRPAGDCGSAEPARELGFGDLVDPLVVEPDGVVVPWVYGIDRRLALGSLADAPLAVLAPAFWPERLAAALDHRDAVAASLVAEHPWPYLNWYAALAARPLGFGRDAGAAVDRPRAGRIPAAAIPGSAASR